jgi:hypothetical protein
VLLCRTALFLSLYTRISGTDIPVRIPATASTVMINKTMKSTRTICPIGAGNGNIPINHHINPKTIRYTIKLIIKLIFSPWRDQKNRHADLLCLQIAVSILIPGQRRNQQEAWMLQAPSRQWPMPRLRRIKRLRQLQ